jgi:acetyl esterase/lipase
MNSVSSYYCAPTTALWFWSAYLQLGDHHDKDSYQAQIDKHELYQLGNVGCINSMLRLIYPQVDIPKELKDHDSAPKVFVVTSSADPLCDDGDDLAACLKEEGANVEKYECIGSHGLGMMFDSKNNNKFAKALGGEVWSKE